MKQRKTNHGGRQPQKKEWKEAVLGEYPHAAAVGAPRKVQCVGAENEHMEEIHAELIPESEQGKPVPWSRGFWRRQKA
ncbi:MAG: hypothetical protein V8S96_03165 [Lachnospiraceae bacterium]